MNIQLNLGPFLNKAINSILIDVRTPKEFAAGHIKGSINIPVFSDEERVIVGTIYKKEGKEKAIDVGLELVGPKLSTLVKTVREISENKELLVYCWRGGMRSGSFAWLMGFAGFKVNTLKGGYKNFRNGALSSFGEKYQLVVLGGKTGSGKSEILYILAKKGEQIIDLEQIACHKGSSFGSLGQLPQPTIEQFENDLFLSLLKLDNTKRIWIEDESRNIGKTCIPLEFWKQMRSSKVIFMDVGLEERIKRLVHEYACFPKLELADAIIRIKKRIGGQNETAALEALEMGDYHTVAEITLKYYDKSYYFGLEKRPVENVIGISDLNDDPETNTVRILETVNKLNLNE